MRKNKTNKRIKNIRKIMALIWTVIIINVLFLSTFSYHIISATDFSGHLTNVIIKNDIQAKRGSILDRNGNILAKTVESYKVICNINPDRINESDTPAYVVDKQHTADLLSPILKTTSEEIFGYLSFEDVEQVELGLAGNNITPAQKEEIEALNLPGIEFVDNYDRYYPNSELAAHLLGYVGVYDGETAITGLMGIEENYNDVLDGKDGKETYQQDSNGYRLPGSSYEIQKAVNGSHIQLTLDIGIQETLELALKNYCNKVDSNEAWGSVVEVDTGKVLAWAQYPSFDLNTLNIENYNNIGISLPYEVGSTMKSFTYAAAMDANPDFNMNATFDSGPFYIDEDKYGNIIRSDTYKSLFGSINNYAKHDYGVINFWEGFSRSANTGIATLLADYIDPYLYEEYLHDLGFFREINTDGFVSAPGVKQYTYSSEQITTAYGQGSTATMLHMMQAYTALLNGGDVVEPYFVEKIINPLTNEIQYEAKTQVVKENVISEESSKRIIEAMKYNADDLYGVSKSYKINGVSIIAKTGTAEVPDGDGYGNDTIMSIAIGMPANDPKVICYYAVRTDTGHNVHNYPQYFKSVLLKTASTLGLSDKVIPDDDENKTNVDEDRERVIGNFSNHSLEYSNKIINNMDCQIVVVGEGNTVINQYPQAGAFVNKDQKVFLLTGFENIRMPDMIGWSRKEINGFFSLLNNFNVKIVGNGVVENQSLEVGQIISENTEITLNLK